MAGAEWWKNAKIYEVYVDKFAGNFANLAAQLDYLEKLGVNTLHILPHYPSPMQDDGYDVMDYLNVRPELGTLDDFDAFLKAAHQRDMKVIIDMVLNHVSEFHPWFLEARSSKGSYRRDYFLWSDTGTELREGWNAPSGFKDSNWIRNEPTEDYYYATFYPHQPDLNWDNPAVFYAMVANMDFWAERGVDGFRLDAAGSLVKRDKSSSKGLPETHAIIKRIRKHLDSKYGGDVIILAEAHQSFAEMKQYFGNGDECHLLYNFPLAEQLFLALMDGKRSRLDTMLQECQDIPKTCAWAVFLRNHDELSLATLSDIERTTLVDYLDPEHRYIFRGGPYHDYTTAMRLGSMFEKRQEKIIEAFRLLYSIPGAQVMYYGDEIGMTNLPVQGGVVDTRVYVRGEFDWLEARGQIQDLDSLFTKTKDIILQSYWPWEIYNPGTRN